MLKLKVAGGYKTDAGSGAEHWSRVIRIGFVDYLPCTSRQLTDSPRHVFHSELHYIDGCLKPFRESRSMLYRHSAHVQHQESKIVHNFNSRDDFIMGLGEEPEYLPSALTNVLKVFLHGSWTSTNSTKED